ncbi:MAG: FG-GAP-like repeat-containing protein [Candidatus Helarchaeota archaeon]
MNRKGIALLIIFSFMIIPLTSFSAVIATDSFANIDFNQPHDNYQATPPSYKVQHTKQPWKKTDIDFTGSIGDSGEYSIGFSKKINLNGQLPGKLAATQGSVELGFKIGLRYDITFGYEFGVDYYRWANDMAVAEGEQFSYCAYVEPDPTTFSLWADISIEPFMELWANFDVLLELAGYTIVDWQKSWSKSISLPMNVKPNLDLGALIGSGLLTPIGALYSSQKVGIELGIPGRLEFGIGDVAGVYFDAGIGAHIQFQIRGLIESLLELSGSANAKFDGGKTQVALKYYDPGKENLKSITIHVPVGSAGKVIDILAHEFEYSVEPGILLSWDGFVDYGAYLHIPTPTQYVKTAKTITEKVCEWLPWPIGEACDTVTKTVYEWVEVAATVVPDIDWDWGDRHEVGDEYWIPFFTIPLLESDSSALDQIEVLPAKEHSLSLSHTWSNNWNNNWTVSLGPTALRLSAYAGYALNLLLKGMMYTYYKPDDQIAGHPFNYYVGVDGDEAGDGSFGGSLAAGYSLELKIPGMEDLIGQEVWIDLISYDFNTSEFSYLDIPLYEVEYSVGYAAISLSSEAEFANLDDLTIAQSANGFVGEWETEPFFTVSTSLDGKIFELISMNLGSLTIEFLFKGRGNLTGDISASGAGSFDSHQMYWDTAGDINYANIYPDPAAQKGDLINILLQNLKYILDLDLVVRISGELYSPIGSLCFSHDFDINLLNNWQADINEDVQEAIKVTAGFTPAKITAYPEEVTAGTAFKIQWETSNSTSGQTYLQYGQNPYPQSSFNYISSFKPVTGGLQEHNETLILNKTGRWYFVAYIISTSPYFSFFSKNISILVKPRLNITTIPENATAGQLITVQWTLFGPSSVESTNLRYSKSPNPSSDPGGGTPVQSGSAGTYSAQLTFEEVGTYYLIAHAQVDKKGDDYFSEIHQIKILPNITITVLPSPNNASSEFSVNWTIKGAKYIDRTYLEYSQSANFSQGVFSTVSQYGYKEEFHETVSLFTKGPWYFRVVASVNGIKETYYSREPSNLTTILPYTEINPSYPTNVSVNEQFKLYWWVFGFNTSVDKTQIYYDNDSDVLTNPLGSTTPKSGNLTDFSDTFSFSQAGRYYFQANFSIDNDMKSWYSDVISILITPLINIISSPENATAFTFFSINYTISGLDLATTPVDLWYSETPDLTTMTPLNQSVKGGIIQGRINLTGLYYIALNLTFAGKQYWTSISSIQIVPHIEIIVPWENPLTDTDWNQNPNEFGIAGIPLTITWVVRNCTVVNHTDIHFKGAPGWEPFLRPLGGDYFKYEIVHNQRTGWMTPEQNGTGSHYYIFSVNVTFYVEKFTWVQFRAHAQCDNKLYDYYSNGSAIPVYPAAEAMHYNYTVVVDKQDISIHPLNFSVTWAMGYIMHPYVGVPPFSNTPNFPGYIPYKVIGIRHANLHYMLNYDPKCPCIINQGLSPNSTQIRSGAPFPGIFTDNITISSVGTYYFRIHVKYIYNSTDENFAYPQHVNRSYWSPLYQINVISYGKYNTTIKAPIVTPPPVVSYADYDGDGDLDMMVGKNYQNSTFTRLITLYFNDGTGNYTAIPSKEILQYSATGGEEIKSITAGHFNGDAFLDFILTNESIIGSTVKGYVFLNDGQCNFTFRSTALDSDSSQEASTYEIADYNGDGISDYIYYSTSSVYYDQGLPDGSHLSDGFFDSTLMPASLKISDMDGTPFLDLHIGYTDGSYAIKPEFPTGPIIPVPNVTASFSDINYPLIADFNFDGFNDSIVVNSTGEVILTLNITIFPTQKVIAYAAGVPNGIAAGDFDADGDLDFVIGAGSDRFQFFFSNYTLDPNPWPGFSTQIVSNKGSVLATGDFNNDTFIDISAYRNDLHILHYLYNYVPPPSITNITVSYNVTTQTINIQNISVYGVEGEPINDTNAYFHWYTILDSNFNVVSPLANLTWNGAHWEALNVNVSYLPEGIYYVNTTFGDKYTFGNNSFALTLSTQFTVDHFDTITGVGVSYIDGMLQRLNITVDYVTNSYSVLGNITGVEAATHSYIIRNATGAEVLVYNNTLSGNFTYGNLTGIFRWEAINVSVAGLPPGDYFITVFFADYLGYDNVTANSSLFNVQHALASKTTPTITYNGNLTQTIKIRNINIQSSYSLFPNLGKGRARIYNYSIYDNVSRTFTGLTGPLQYDGFSWYADVSVASLPEGSYYLNAFFKDTFNATVTTSNSSVFTIDHTLDLSNLQVLYTGFLIQKFNVTITPISSWNTRGTLNATEALLYSYKLYSLNGSTPLVTGNLSWNGNLWSSIINVAQLEEDNYFIQVTFADSYATVTQNSTLISIYHYIGVTFLDFSFNQSTSLLSIENLTAISSYHGMVNNTTVIPSLYSFTIFGNLMPGNITGNFTYGSPWHQSGINLSALLYSSTFTVRIEFEVNESYGLSKFEFWIPPQKAPTLNPISPNPDENGLIYLNWDAVNGTTIYYIYRDTVSITSVQGLTPIATTTNSFYQDTITAEGTYYYVIVAGNPAGNTSISNVESVIVDFPGGEIPSFTIIWLFIGVILTSIPLYRKRRSLSTNI